jgi:hypothetical protein
MFKKNRLALLTVSTLVMALALGTMAFTPIDSANADTPGEGDPGQGGGQHGPGFGNDEYLAEILGISIEELQAAVEEARSAAGGPGSGNDFEQLLAEALGISTDELQSARQAAREAALAQALADGEITQEEYDLFQARQALREYTAREEILAAVLGISTDELRAALDAGKQIGDLLDELSISQEDFQAATQAAQEAALQQAVNDGVITQDQADQIQQGGGRGPGGPGHPGEQNGSGGMGGPGGNPGNQGGPGSNSNGGPGQGGNGGPSGAPPAGDDSNG